MIASCRNGSEYVRMKVGSKVRGGRDGTTLQSQLTGENVGLSALPIKALFYLVLVRLIMRGIMIG
jgi:hypothetical protein